jgi:class 3 adenylate cyclase
MSIAPPELPTGTVTFLLTDIERSTELVRRLGDGWPAVAGEHKRLLREAVSGAGGNEVDSRGEEVFFVFRRAQDAVAAAVAAQRSLGSRSWPKGAAVRVRMGLHTGAPALGDDGGYLGIDVHRTARICAAGHGGQVLVSEATRALALDTEVRFVDLGEYKFRGFARAERVYQLAAEGLTERFPSLRTASAAPFAGKERSLAKAAQNLVSRGRPKVPPVLRRRPPTARRLADLSWEVRSSHGGSPEAARPALLELARSLVVLSRTANDADRRLARLDRRAFERKLAETRELAVISRYAQTRADTLARQAELLDELTRARAPLDQRIDELEWRAQLVDAAESVSLRAEVDSLNERLRGALDRVAADVGDVAERLHRTIHRGIYRQGDLWAIPYYDSQGVERVQRFDDLDEARRFRRQQQLIESARIAQEKTVAGGDTAGAGAAGTGMYGGGDGNGGGGGNGGS